jgi:hypothetical protein
MIVTCQGPERSPSDYLRVQCGACERRALFQVTLRGLNARVKVSCFEEDDVPTDERLELKVSGPRFVEG